MAAAMGGRCFRGMSWSGRRGAGVHTRPSRPAAGVWDVPAGRVRAALGSPPPARPPPRGSAEGGPGRPARPSVRPWVAGLRGGPRLAMPGPAVPMAAPRTPGPPDPRLPPGDPATPPHLCRQVRTCTCRHGEAGHARAGRRRRARVGASPAPGVPAGRLWAAEVPARRQQQQQQPRCPRGEWRQQQGVMGKAPPHVT